VNASYRDLCGVKHTTTLAHLSAGSQWRPTSPLQFLDPGLRIIAQTAGTISFTFVAEGTGGNWQIDDVYVDPFRQF
jgi:hypothetical protein